MGKKKKPTNKTKANKKQNQTKKLKRKKKVIKGRKEAGYGFCNSRL